MGAQHAECPTLVGLLPWEAGHQASQRAYPSLGDDGAAEPRRTDGIIAKLHVEPNEVCETLRRHLASPVIIAAGASAMTGYGMDYFSNNYGDRLIKLLSAESKKSYDHPVVNAYEQWPLADYIRAIREHRSDLYMAQILLKEMFPDLYGKLPLKHLLGDKIVSALNVWIGPAASKSKLHYDADHNFLIQVEGRKEVRLISPRDSRYCYQHQKSFYDGFSPVDSYNPDLEQYPEFAHATLYHAILDPGDILFIPVRWWHDIRALEPSVSYNIWWVNWAILSKGIPAELVYRTKALLGMYPALEKKNSYLCALLKSS